MIAETKELNIQKSDLKHRHYPFEQYLEVPIILLV